MSATDWRPDSELVTPVELKWRLAFGDLRGTLRVEMDLGILPTTNAALEFFMTEVFRSAWAPLISIGATVTLCSVVGLKLGGPIFAFSPLALRGMVIGSPRITNRSGVALAYLGGQGPDANRRFYIPMMPEYFSTNGVLSDLAIGLFVTSLRGLKLGCDGDIGGLGPKLIAFRPPRAANAWRPFRPAQYALVQQLVALSYIDRTTDNF